MVDKISIKKVKQDTESMFEKKEFVCSEAVVASIHNNFGLDMPEMIAMASGFAGGMGRTKCVCGAVVGGTLAIGALFGRTEPGDSKIERAVALSAELSNSFRENHLGSLCCKVLTCGYDAGQNREMCKTFTGEMAQKCAEIIAREMGIEVID